jgi:hypothetical protein
MSLDRIRKFAEDLRPDMPEAKKDLRMRQICVLSFQAMKPSDRRKFVSRLNGIDFDDAPLTIATILADWPRVVASGFTGWDQKFAEDMQELIRKNKFWKPSEKQETEMRRIHALSIQD